MHTSVTYIWLTVGSWYKQVLRTRMPLAYIGYSIVLLQHSFNKHLESGLLPVLALHNAARFGAEILGCST